jgi:integrase
MGQRQGDIIRMPRSVIRDGNLVLRQSKTRVGVSLPISMIDRLQTRLDAELARHATREAAALQAGVKAPLPVAIIVSEETGRAYRADNFRHVFARVRKEMAKTKPHFPVEHLMPGRDMTDPLAFTVQTADLTFMQLRHTAVTRLAEAGCDTTLISAITGHAQTTVQQLMDRYMVRTAAMARTAFQRRLDAEKGADPKKVSDGN